MPSQTDSLSNEPDFAELLEANSEAAPSGIDLEGSDELSAFETAVREPELALLSSVSVEDERDWRAIERQARSLLIMSKDLRIAVQFARARLQVDGVFAFCAAAGFVSELAQRQWATLYPALDAQDGDATARINALQELSSAPLVARLRSARLATAPGYGPITLKEVVSAGGMSLAKSSPESAALESTLGVDGIRNCLEQVQSARRALLRLASFVREQSGQPLRFTALVAVEGGRPGVLDLLEQFLASCHARLIAGDAPALDDQDATGPVEAAVPADAKRAGGPGVVKSRADVVATLDLLCAYYAEAEPSSPVPLLLRRAQRLVSLDFFAIIRDLAREGIPEVARIAGLEVEAQGSASAPFAVDNQPLLPVEIHHGFAAHP